MSIEHEECQILVVSSPHSLGYPTILRLTQLPPSQTPDADSRLPWTLTNKYYTAPVYFQFQPLSKPPAKPLWPPEVDDVHAPAVLWVFDKAELNKAEFEALLPAFEAHEAEICLAVGVNAAASPETSTSRYAIEGREDDDLEAYFMKHGFEYVDADETRPPSEGGSVRFDVGGLPRVIESLSTIMWPSMKRKPSSTRKSLGLAIYEDEDEEEVDADAIPADLTERLGGMALSTDTFEGRLALQTHQAAARSDTEALEAFLDAEDDPPAGKEDDFTEFVSASASTSTHPISDAPWAESPIADNADHTDYAALDDLDDELPTEAEVLQARTRIFGSTAPTREAPSHEGLEDQFDLNAALGALQSMREEISNLPDKERRQAAARVALGLLKGLGLDEGDLEDVMAHGD